MNRAEALKEILDVMRDEIHDNIISAFIAIEQLGVPPAEVDRLLADQMLYTLMDLFPQRFPELHSRFTWESTSQNGVVSQFTELDD